MGLVGSSVREAIPSVNLGRPSDADALDDPKAGEGHVDDSVDYSPANEGGRNIRGGESRGEGGGRGKKKSQHDAASSSSSFDLVFGLLCFAISPGYLVSFPRASFPLGRGFELPVIVNL